MEDRNPCRGDVALVGVFIESELLLVFIADDSKGTLPELSDDNPMKDEMHDGSSASGRGLQRQPARANDEAREWRRTLLTTETSFIRRGQPYPILPITTHDALALSE